MTSHDPEFWQSLRTQLDAESRNEFAVVETHLQACKDRPLPEGFEAELTKRIHEPVLALQNEPEPAAEPAQDMSDAPAEPGRIRRFVAPIGFVLLAAFVSRMWIWPERQDSRETMTFEHALAAMETPRVGYRVRESALNRIYMIARDGMRAIARSLEFETAAGSSDFRPLEEIQQMLSDPDELANQIEAFTPTGADVPAAIRELAISRNPARRVALRRQILTVVLVSIDSLRRAPPSTTLRLRLHQLDREAKKLSDR